MDNQPLGPVVVDIASTVLAPKEHEILTHPMTGGLILFARNYESPDQLKQLVHSIRQVRPNLLIMVDQEGGRVQRFRSGFTHLPPIQVIGSLFEGNEQAALAMAYDHAWVMASELLAVGIDLSLAPVLDCDDGFSDVIGDRAFSKRPQVVAQLAGAYIRGMNDAGMRATAKHFPGHGAVKADSHKTLPVDHRPLEAIITNDLVPFIKNLNHYSALMPAHIVFDAVDSQPVGFSSVWIQDLLRQRFGFGGVVFSDDLSMEGAAVAGDHVARAMAAYKAGCNGLLVCNAPDKAAAVLEAMARNYLVTRSSLETLRGQPLEGALVNSSIYHQRVDKIRDFQHYV